MTEMSTLAAVASAPTAGGEVPRWRAVFADLLTDRTIDTLPLQGVSMDVAISAGGTLTGSIPVPNEAMGARVAPIIEGRTAVYGHRSYAGVTEVWFGGIVWTRTEHSDDKGNCSLEIQAGTFDTYLGRREIRSTLSYIQSDQLFIARDLWTEAQSEPGSDIGVAVGTETCGVLREHSWLGTDAAKFADALEQVAAQDNGFEWLVDVYLDGNGDRVKVLRLGYPRIGNPAVVTRVTRPGLLRSYDLTGDASRGGTSFRARGTTPDTDASDSPPLVSDVYTAEGWLSAGWPLLDVTDDYPDVVLVGTLNDKAKQARDTRSGTVRLADLRVDPRCGFAPAHLGTSVRAVVVDPLHPRNPDGSPSFDITRRVVGMSVVAAERGKGEELGLVFEQVEDDDA